MIRFIVSILLSINILQASSEHYYIQLGSFKQLKVLVKNIEALPSELRSHIIVVRSNNWYIPFAYYTTQQNLLYSKVPEYKQYFPDAYINHSSYILHHPIIYNYSQPITTEQTYSPPQVTNSYHTYATPHIEQAYQNVAISEDDNTLNLPIRRSSTTPFIPRVEKTFTEKPIENHNFDTLQQSEVKHYRHFNKKMLSGQHYYLTYKSTNESPSLLIKVSFENHQVTYQPILGDMQMTKANYLIENNKLYMFAESFTQNGAFSTLDEHRDNHFLVSSWANNKKLNTLRYYYRLNDAKEYLGIATSKGLASTLEEGIFDDNFLSE
jgi:hypothetical protein